MKNHVCAGALLLCALLSENALAVDCQVSYVNDWGSGYQMDIEVTNNDSSAVSDWAVAIEFNQDPQVTNAWNANFSYSGNNVVASSLGWNGSLAPGASASFGVQGNHNGSFVEPVCYDAGIVEPTVEPTVVPTVEPTVVPTVEPTVVPTVEPTVVPTVEPTVVPTVEPTVVPTVEPTVVPTVEPSNEVTCSVVSENVWNSGFQYDVDVVNNSSASITGWTVQLEWDNTNVSFESGWNASFSGSNPVVAENVEHNGALAPGGVGSFGFQGSYSGTLGVPSCSVVPKGTAGGGSGSGDDSQWACGIDPTTIPSNDDWLTTDGNQIVDSNGKSVWLTGANWFGFNATERVFHGLWSVNLNSTLKSMAERGINLIRVPLSTELMKEWMNGVAPVVTTNTAENPNLVGATSLEVFDEFLIQAKSCGIKVMVDAHSAEADNSGHIEPLWYKGDITSADFLDTWEWFADRYKGDDTIIAYDLENEPHGVPNGSLGNDLQKQDNETWEEYCTRKPETEDVDYAKWDDSQDENNWRYAATQAAERIMGVNPNVLIMVEGIESTPIYGKEVNHKSIPDPALSEKCHNFDWWGGNLRLAKDLPVEVPGHNDQIMYSPHDYGPLVYKQGWFYDGFSRDTLRADVWQDNWLYLHTENISPVLIGEWGGFMDGGDNEKWMEAIRDEIVEKHLHHTFWCLNPNSGDTGGLLENDWVSWDEDKYALLKPSLWAEDGKFVGLDKKVPLGGTSGTGVTRP